MKNCTRCAAELADNEEICPYCGQALVEKQKAVSSNGAYCKKCGNYLNPGDLFCNKCGTRFEEPKTVGAEPSYADGINRTESKKDEGSYLIGFLLAFFLGLIGLLICLIGIKKPKTTKACIIGFIAGFVLNVIVIYSGLL